MEVCCVEQGTLTKEVMDIYRLQTAHDELCKISSCPKDDLEELREFVSSRPDIPNLSDRRIMQFHFSTFFNTDDTKSAIQAYYRSFKEYTCFFENRRLSDTKVQSAMQVIHQYISPVRTHDDRQIVFLKLIDSDSSKFDLVAIAKYFLMLIEASTVLYGMAENSEAVVDCALISFRHFFKVVADISAIQKLITLYEGALPIRAKAIHVINATSLISRILGVIRPFMNDDLFSKIIIYREGEMDQFRKTVPIECLPAETGGKLGSLASLTEKFQASMSIVEPFFAEEEQLVANTQECIK